MEKALHTLQVLAKIGRVMSKVVWICCLVGAIGCAIGIASLAVGVDNVLKLGNLTIHGIVEQEAGMSMGTMYSAMAVAMIFCIGEMVLAIFAERYFKHELADGTPFTFEGAAEMKRLGILTIVLPVCMQFVAEITYEIMKHSFQNVTEMHSDDLTSVGLGIMFLVMSVMFRYVAELENSHAAGANQ